MNKEKWVPVSEAAKLRGVKRQSIYYHIDVNNLKKKEIVGRECVELGAVMSLKKRAGNKNKEARRIKGATITSESTKDSPNKSPNKSALHSTSTNHELIAAELLQSTIMSDSQLDPDSKVLGWALAKPSSLPLSVDHILEIASQNWTDKEKSVIENLRKMFRKLNDADYSVKISIERKSKF